jgi:hypothetical protein
MLSADLKFHFATSRFQAHTINTYIEQPAGGSYSISRPFPHSSFFTMCQTNQQGKNMFCLPYSVLTGPSSKLRTSVILSGSVFWGGGITENVEGTKRNYGSFVKLEDLSHPAIPVTCRGGHRVVIC